MHRRDFIKVGGRENTLHFAVVTPFAYQYAIDPPRTLVRSV
jgi:hypothetical protein